jgi:hypothetical protein
MMIVRMMNKQLRQEQNFDEVEFISGYVMRLIKLTEQNIQLAKQERELNVNRQTHNKDNWVKIRS